MELKHSWPKQASCTFSVYRRENQHTGLGYGLKEYARLEMTLSIDYWSVWQLVSRYANRD